MEQTVKNENPVKLPDSQLNGEANGKPVGDSEGQVTAGVNNISGD